jgi:hypothetical protein
MFYKFKNRVQKIAMFSSLLLFASRAEIFSDTLRRDANSQTSAFTDAAGLIHRDVTFSHIVTRVIMVFLTIIGLIFISLIIYGGFQWMTARGNEEKIRKAQDILKHAIWGLIITLSAYSIGYFILKFLLTGEAPTPEGWG